MSHSSTEENNPQISRRESLSISALLNDEQIDPYDCLPTENDKKKLCRVSWSGPNYSSEEELQQQCDPLWRHGTTGVHESENSLIFTSIAKAKRRRISPEQYDRLMAAFLQNDTPSSSMREQLAHEIERSPGKSAVNVGFFDNIMFYQVWFQNRRAKRNRSKSIGDSSSNRSVSVPGGPAALARSRRPSYNFPYPPKENRNTSLPMQIRRASFSVIPTVHASPFSSTGQTTTPSRLMAPTLSLTPTPTPTATPMPTPTSPAVSVSSVPTGSPAVTATPLGARILAPRQHHDASLQQLHTHTRSMQGEPFFPHGIQCAIAGLTLSSHVSVKPNSSSALSSPSVDPSSK
ncbi:hypothetical protein BDF14DRAFT_1743960 [Spinellus fusiger]|nr:hypothetical protein BDF14DRAFT_1743960 [Spinellus fusiger]